MTDFSGWSDKEINEAIFRSKGWFIVEQPFSHWEDSNGSTWYLEPIDYTHDWRLCGELLEEMKDEYHDLHLFWQPFAWMWVVQVSKVQLGDYKIFRSANPQRAICEAWLAWKEQE